MQHFLFASLSSNNPSVFNSVESLISATSNIFSIALKDEKELLILLTLLGIPKLPIEILESSTSFSSMIDISKINLPEFSNEEFDIFYESWLSESGREPSMDEYGQLVFIHGQAVNWNQQKYRVILNERP